MLSAESTIELPPRPAQLADAPAAVWSAPLTLPTYHPLPPERFPAYLDRRVYQGSSGRVYPLPFHHAIAEEAVPHAWQAVHLQNEWLHVVVLPELGGRVHVVRDLAGGEDLFYANPVVKPALVGLAGPWIAGGVEFNWPQHHRPATYLPTDWAAEVEEDGAVVVRCSDHDPFTRMRGVHALRLRPGSSVLELAVRLYNRSELPQSFLWWANVAARVDDDYQSFFPHDATFVADHAKRAVSAYPHADRPYYGVDYPSRAGQVHRAADGTALTGDRLDWYRNIPVPTSYMCLSSREDFFGGYDHATGVGFVHVADHQVAVGKKQWTWGNSPFGHAWDANLSDDGAHYVELMAGVFTDNQPDFARLAPGETKVFSQHWYPVRATGAVDRASLDAAVSLVREGERARLAVVVTRPRRGVRVELRADGRLLAADEVDLDPGSAHTAVHDVPAAARTLAVTVVHEGRVLVAWDTGEARTAGGAGTAAGAEEPASASEPPAPGQVATVEELALVAQHLELYRHATRSPEPYWREALRRDPGHAPSLVGLALRACRAARWKEAQELLERAVTRLTAHHPTPEDTTAHHLLGLVLEALGREEEAYERHGRASWSRSWRAAAGYRMARLDARRGRTEQALHRLADVRRTEPEHLQAAALEVVCLRRLGRSAQAARVLARARALDPLDAWLRHLDGLPASADAQTCLDVALELAGAGEGEDALAVLELAQQREAHRPAGQSAAGPLLGYHRAVVLESLGRAAQAAAAREAAREAPAAWCFPGRVADAAALEAAGEDPRARALRGHWLYAVGRHADAAEQWAASAAADPSDPVVHRNLGLDLVNRGHDLAGAKRAYERALALAPDDARLRFEADQLDALRGTAPAQRLARWLERWDLAEQRHDALVEVAHLLVGAGRAERAVQVLTGRTFQPWEGGEGQALSAWERARTRLALDALAAGDAGGALAHLRAALESPRCLGEARHPLASTAQLHLLLGDAHAAAGEETAAREAWRDAAEQRGDFLGMSAQEHSETTAWSVLALHRLGRSGEGRALAASLRAFRNAFAAAAPSVDYFATSLPDLLLFEEDPLAVRERRVAVLDAQLAVLDGEPARARRLLAAPLLASSRHAADLAHALSVHDLVHDLTHDLSAGSPRPATVPPALVEEVPS
ncbi:DUF5107 domain-containing protein [Kineococcus sp. T13]|uniref:DUF5107 domain-containing protein n=1 Tax=Kineococcus vitellinus TaxID=2696565 RepID=UPI001412FC33|nr:DUF5107 domain-containing protein [Kineococcus vitellinus]NAZ74224.1 DUF5107 domain-containing protein [Kineococcus vitellinus]